MFGSSVGARRGSGAARLGVLAVVSSLTMAFASSPAAAHEGIASSDPASGSVIEQPIDSVTIDFGVEIGDTAQIALLGPEGRQIASYTTVTSSSTATTNFELIEDEGAYTVNYLATSVVDGHVLGGAITFSYGDDSADSMSPVLFGAIALVILGIGAWFSWRARQRGRVERDSDVAPVDAT